MTTAHAVETRCKCFIFVLLITGILSKNASAQNYRIERMQSLYDSIRYYGIIEPKTVLAIAILETGWLECSNCHLQKITYSALGAAMGT
jgi:hypothetical protein